MHKKLHYIANVNNDSFIDYIYKYRDTFISNIILFAHIASQAIVFTAKKHSWCGEEFEHLFCLIVCCGRTRISFDRDQTYFGRRRRSLVYTTANDIIWYQKEENQNLMRVCMWVECKGLARILLHGQTQKSTLVDCAVETSNKGIIMWNEMRLIEVGLNVN